MRNSIMQKLFTALLIGLMPWLAHAQLTIDVVGGAEKQDPIAITGFPGEGALPVNITQVVRGNLARTGEFKILDVSNVSPVPTEASQVNFGEWNQRGAKFIAIGTVAPAANNQLEVRVRVLDVAKMQLLGSVTYTMSANQARLTAHRVSDYIYEKITGTQGAFATRIAYVIKQRDRYELQIADSDGQNPQTALSSREPIISPSWAPDGARIAYVSFESRKPVVYVHNVATGARQVIANYKGSNSAPAWHPNGNQLAVVLTKDGNSEIYLVGASGGNATDGAQRLTNSASIDTEPRFAADGTIYFTSDRGGGPQIYRMKGDGSEVKRVTFKGGYNVSPRIAPDGKTMVYVQRDNGFNLMSMDVSGAGAGQQEIQLTKGGRDESPSFAPNGKMILYATEEGGKGALAGTTPDGKVRQRLTTPAAEIREPTWAPYMK